MGCYVQAAFINSSVNTENIQKPCDVLVKGCYIQCLFAQVLLNTTGKKVPDLPLDIQIKLNSSAIIHSLEGLKTSHNSWKVFDTDRLKWHRQAEENNSSEKVQTVYIFHEIHSWRPINPWHWSQCRPFATTHCHQISANKLHHVIRSWLSVSVCSFLTQCQNQNQTRNEQVASRMHFLEALSLDHQGLISHLQAFWEQTSARKFKTRLASDRFVNPVSGDVNACKSAF